MFPKLGRRRSTALPHLIVNMNEQTLSSINWTGRFASRVARMRRSTVRELLKVTRQPGMISFALGLPPAGLFPVAETRRAAQAVLDAHGGQALQYSETEGLSELRDWIAARYSQPGMSFTRANVLVTSGSQQALDLIGRVFLEEGDAVLAENPTYLALLGAWRPYGVDFLAAPCDDEGMRVSELGPLLERRPKLLYTTPNFQNPQGTTLSHSRREELVELTARYDTGIVEDDPYGELRYEGEPRPGLFALDAIAAERSGRRPNVIHTGTFSKVLAPGLRIGWVIGPEEVVDKLVVAKQAADLHTGTFSQNLVCELLRDGVLERHLPRLREVCRERRDAMLAALHRYFPSDARWTKPEGGMFLMVTLAPDVDTTALLPQALARGVAFAPGADFHVGGDGRNTMRLNFSNCAPEQIEEGVRRIGKVLPCA